MLIRVECFGQLGAVSDTNIDVELAPEQKGLTDLLGALANQYGPAFGDIVFDVNRNIRPSLVVIVNGTVADKSNPPELKDGDAVRFLTAIAGG